MVRRAHLKITRQEVHELLQGRIQEAANIVSIKDIKSPADLTKAEEREDRWHKYNRELLTRAFTTYEYADDYTSSRVQVHQRDDRYFDPSFSTLISRLIASVENQKASLASIIERLDLIEIGGSSSNFAPGLNEIFRLAERLDIVVRKIRERHNDRETLDVKDEHDLQDLFHALLKIYFDDVRPEEWTPTYAGAASRVDFFLPDVQTFVELKMARPSLSTKQLGEQLIVDIEKYKKYPDCRTLICIVYDPEGGISNPRGVENDLNSAPGDIGVRVTIVPKR